MTSLVRGSAAYSGAYRVLVVDQTIDAEYVHRHVVRVAEDPVTGELVGFYSLLIPGRGLPGEAELDFMFRR